MQDADHLCGIGEQRAVEDAVGAQGQQARLVVGGGDAESPEPAQLAGVAPGLVRRVDPDTDQLELGMGHDALDGGAADGSRRPLDHAIRHCRLLAIADAVRAGASSPRWPASARTVATSAPSASVAPSTTPIERAHDVRVTSRTSAK